MPLPVVTSNEPIPVVLAPSATLNISSSSSKTKITIVYVCEKDSKTVLEYNIPQGIVTKRTVNMEQNWLHNF